MKTILLICLMMLTATTSAQEQSAIPLWPDGAPGALGKDPKDIPTLTPYISPTAQASAGTIVILPGGGYVNLAAHEGAGFAEYFAKRGLTTFVLKYRLGKDGYHHPIELGDAARALRYVRANAAQWKIDPAKVGIMGSSAGGHLASALMTHFDSGNPSATDPIEKQSSRPDFGILCYPVITMGEKAHAGSKTALLGPNPSEELIKQTSSELGVTKETPPGFIWAGLNDRTVPVDNSIMFAAAMRAAGVPCESHIYENAGHGIGLGNRNTPNSPPHPWVNDMTRWLTARGITLTEPAK